MNKLKTLLVALPVTLLLVVAAISPAYAQDGTSGDTNNSDASSTQSTDQQTHGGDHTTTQNQQSNNETETETEQNSDSATEHELRTKGQELLDKARKDNKVATTQSQRLARCEEHKAGLQTKVDNLVKNAQSYKARIDEVYNKALTYQIDNNITVSGWDTLVGNADAAKAQAQLSVEALSKLKPTVDCNNVSVASDVATFKAAAAQARTDLQAYKTAVKAVLTALEGAKQ